MMKPGGKITEAIGFGVFMLAAGNIMVYTVQSFKETYTRPPLSMWQKGAGEKPGANSTSPNGEPKKKKKEQGIVPKILKLLPIPGAEQLGELVE